MQQLKDLSLLELDFSLEATGFQMGEIDLQIASLDDPPPKGDDPADLVPELPAGPHQLGGFSQIACPRWRRLGQLPRDDMLGVATICAAGEREEEQVVPDPGHSWAQQRASHSSEEGRS